MQPTVSALHFLPCALDIICIALCSTLGEIKQPQASQILNLWFDLSHACKTLVFRSRLLHVLPCQEPLQTGVVLRDPSSWRYRGALLCPLTMSEA